MAPSSVVNDTCSSVVCDLGTSGSLDGGAVACAVQLQPRVSSNNVCKNEFRIGVPKEESGHSITSDNSPYHSLDEVNERERLLSPVSIFPDDVAIIMLPMSSLLAIRQVSSTTSNSRI